MKTLRHFALLAGFGLAFGQALADPVNIISPSLLNTSQLANFEDLTGGANAGTNYNNIIASGGVSFGERFLGQSNNPVNNFDVLSGTPSDLLSLVAGPANQNLAIVTYNGSNVLGGLGAFNGGHPDFDALGEGSFAALFGTGQSEFGFDVLGGEGGRMFISFFARDGSLIDTAAIDLTSANASYAFRREGNLTDIAGFSVYNNDPSGVFFDNLRFNLQAGGNVPEPGSLALVGLALLGAAAARRFKA